MSGSSSDSSSGSSSSSSSSGSSSEAAAPVDLAKLDKKKVLRADERRRRAGDEEGAIEDYLSSSDDDDGGGYASGSDGGSDGGSDSESDAEEDENGILVSPEIDVQIMKALAAIRSKDKSVYDPSVNFFSDEAIQKSKDAWKSKAARADAKGLTLAEYQHKVNVEHGGLVDEEFELKRAVPAMTHVEEQEALRKAFKSAALAAASDDDDGDGDDDDDAGGLLVKKEKTEQELAREDAEYRKFLLDNMGGDLADRRAFERWATTAPDSADAEPGAGGGANADQAFLMNYILNRGWVNRDVGPSVDELEAKAVVDVEEDDDLLARTNDFEAQHNLRVGEDGDLQIKRYPRNIEGSMRRKDERRKLARERAKERKAEAKRQKTEELKRLKNQKKKEILEKLKEIQAITGNSTVGFDALDLDGDYDPEKFAAQMDKMFEAGAQNYDPSVKPEWDDDIDIGDIDPDADEGSNSTSSSRRRGNKRKHGDVDADDPDFVMDADYLEGGPAVDKEALDATAAELQDKVSAYMEKYHRLGFEDIVGGDLPTRFKYVNVKPVDYGLTPAEILLADEKLLNSHVSVKRLAAYRPDWKVEEDKAKYSNRKRAIYIKKKAAASRLEWEESLKGAKASGKKRKDKPAKPAAKDAKEPPKAGKASKAAGKAPEPADAAEPPAKKPNRRQRKKANLAAAAAATE
ncbi:Ribosome biogenesis protein Kri1 [Coemansia javaensis]|uniref:Ribosome biogenesis protein Kri1 n=1 Tax=Coemansia javaensis TaxID=2761396 RepID=A0A9W8LJ82_9FUNG|nr:Ribosome biogenesis protein Kri1 [Coemansia javaensis]